MSNKISTIKERILYLLECKEITKSKFFEKIDMTYGNFTGKSKKTPLNSDAIGNILLEIPDVNPEWLLTGNGQMLKESRPVKEEKGDETVPAQQIFELLKAQLEEKDRQIAALTEVLKGKNDNAAPVEKQRRAVR